MARNSGLNSDETLARVGEKIRDSAARLGGLGSDNDLPTEISGILQDSDADVARQLRPHSLFKLAKQYRREATMMEMVPGLHFVVPDDFDTMRLLKLRSDINSLKSAIAVFSRAADYAAVRAKRPGLRYVNTDDPKSVRGDVLDQLGPRRHGSTFDGVGERLVRLAQDDIAKLEPGGDKPRDATKLAQRCHEVLTTWLEHAQAQLSEQVVTRAKAGWEISPAGTDLHIEKSATTEQVRAIGDEQTRIGASLTDGLATLAGVRHELVKATPRSLRPETAGDVCGSVIDIIDRAIEVMDEKAAEARQFDFPAPNPAGRTLLAEVRSALQPERDGNSGRKYSIAAITKLDAMVKVAETTRDAARDAGGYLGDQATRMDTRGSRSEEVADLRRVAGQVERLAQEVAAHWGSEIPEFLSAKDVAARVETAIKPDAVHRGVTG